RLLACEPAPTQPSSLSLHDALPISPGGVTGLAGADRLCAPRERLVNLIAPLRGPSEALLPGPSERPKADVISPVVRHLPDGGDDFTTPPRLLTRGANVVRLLLRGRLVGLVHQAVG